MLSTKTTRSGGVGNERRRIREKREGGVLDAGEPKFRRACASASRRAGFIEMPSGLWTDGWM